MAPLGPKETFFPLRKTQSLPQINLSKKEKSKKVQRGRHSVFTRCSQRVSHLSINISHSSISTSTDPITNKFENTDSCDEDTWDIPMDPMEICVSLGYTDQPKTESLLVDNAVFEAPSGSKAESIAIYVSGNLQGPSTPNPSNPDIHVISFVSGVPLCHSIKRKRKLPDQVVVLDHNESQILLLGTVNHPMSEHLILPARVDVLNIQAYSNCCGEELCFKGFDILLYHTGRLGWVPCVNGVFPSDALPVGANGKFTLFAARAQYNGEWHFGWVSEECPQGFISVKGEERLFPRYEVLSIRD